MNEKYVIGIDFGTLSGRSILVRCSDGKEINSCSHEYKHGVIDNYLPNSTKKLPPDYSLQYPDDYIDVLKMTIPKILKEMINININDIIGISIDFTACTVLPIDNNGKPLCEFEKYKNNPHSYVKLWKHHSAQKYADRINKLAHARNEEWIKRYGGKISCEWEFSKGILNYIYIYISSYLSIPNFLYFMKLFL
jgi:L-ribulokinase